MNKLKIYNFILIIKYNIKKNINNIFQILNIIKILNINNIIEISSEIHFIINKNIKIYNILIKIKIMNISDLIYIIIILNTNNIIEKLNILITNIRYKQFHWNIPYNNKIKYN